MIRYTQRYFIAIIFVVSFRIRFPRIPRKAKLYFISFGFLKNFRSNIYITRITCKTIYFYIKFSYFWVTWPARNMLKRNIPSTDANVYLQLFHRSLYRAVAINSFELRLVVSSRHFKFQIYVWCSLTCDLLLYEYLWDYANSKRILRLANFYAKLRSYFPDKHILQLQWVT